MARTGHYGKDLKAEFNAALIHYGMKTRGHPLKQKEFNPRFSPTHINNVVSGRSTNPALRQEIEIFVKKYYVL